MTNEKAPERIWLQWVEPPYDLESTFCESAVNDHDPEYIRHDLHLARIEELEQQVTEYALRSMDQQKQIEGLQKEKLEAVAAAYEDAWDVADAWDYGDDSGPAKVANGIKKDLNSRTPADAQAALEADRKRVREEALREALAKEDRCGFVSREDILALVRQDDSMIEGDKNDD